VLGERVSCVDGGSAVVAKDGSRHASSTGGAMSRVGKTKRQRRQARLERQRAAWHAKRIEAAKQPDWQRGAWTEYPGEDHQAVADEHGVSFGTMDIDTGEVTIQVKPRVETYEKAFLCVGGEPWCEVTDLEITR
jgi:hypothetical protein